MTPTGPWSAQYDDATPTESCRRTATRRCRNRIACVTLTAIQNQTICARQSRRVVQSFAAPNRRSGAIAEQVEAALAHSVGDLV